MSNRQCQDLDICRRQMPRILLQAPLLLVFSYHHQSVKENEQARV